jgi:hypothetical protein
MGRIQNSQHRAALQEDTWETGVAGEKSITQQPAIRWRSVYWFTGAFHLLQCHPWPCMLLNLVFTRIRVLPRSHSFSKMHAPLAVQTGCRASCTIVAVPLAHASQCCIALDVHGRADVRMAHELLLVRRLDSYLVNRHPVRVSKRAGFDVGGIRTPRKSTRAKKGMTPFADVIPLPGESVGQTTQ